MEKINYKNTNSDQSGSQGANGDRIEGRNPVYEALKAGRTINKIWVQKRTGRPDTAISKILKLARQTGAVIIETDKSVLDKMAESHGHQGIIAQAAAHAYIDLDSHLDKIFTQGKKPFILILDSLQESYNLGSILRIADAAKVDAVVIPKRRSIALDAAVGKASAGAIEHVPVARVGNLTDTVLRLKEKGFWIAGTDAAAAQTYHEADWSGALAMVIGSEGRGIGKALLQHCDFVVSIPMCGQVNSLNAAVAAGIIVFEARRQRDLNKH